MLIDAARTLDSLVTMTAPGASVPPVAAALQDVSTTIRAELPALRRAGLGASSVDGLERIANSTGQLHDSLDELVRVDGMATFDPAFAQDDHEWDAWFASSAQVVREAAQRVGAQPTSSTRSV
jgi:hypothetical protein